MIPFIELAIKDLLEKKIDFSNTLIIFPGKRPIIFFKKTLKKLGYVGIIPDLITIEDWVCKITDFEIISGIKLWFSFYTIYANTVNEPKSFQEFLKWAPTLLSDFNDLDKSLSSAKEFFYALSSSERIEKWGQEDWEKDMGLAKQQLFFWKEMENVYFATQEYFKKIQKSYDGFIYKEALHNLSSYLKRNNSHLVFIGFNALTKVEEKIITYCLDEGNASVYWEADAYYLDNKDQEAGDFFRKYQKWKFYEKNSFNFKSNNFCKDKVINTYSVSNSINQVKLIGNILKEFTEKEIENTAVVLADENLLFPLLNSLPSAINKINITMGIPLKHIPIVSFFDNLILLHTNRIEKKHHNNRFYFQDLFNFFGAVLINQSDSEKDFISYLHKNNYSYISIDLININLQDSIYLSLLQDFKTTKELIDALIKWIDWLIVEKKEAFSSLTLEVLIHFHQIFKILGLELTKNIVEVNFSSLNYLYLTLKNSSKIPFVGEPIIGLQILGMLETRLLNFNRVFILDVNEGIISPDNQENSLVPFDYRKNFNFSTFKDRDAIFAYYFYRFLQNAKEVHLFYSEGTSKMRSLEKSRFITQLEIESSHKINKIIAKPNFSITQKENTEIEKNETVINKIIEIFKKGISPSSLKSYIRNPLDFYFSKILEIKEVNKLEVFMDQKSIGSVIHNCLQEIYKEYLHQLLIPSDFIKIKKNIPSIVSVIFKNSFKEGEVNHGKNHLIYQVVLKMIEKIIEADEKLVNEGNELIIEALELKIEAPLHITDDLIVNFKGEIDRVDSLNGVKRILDYKTGKIKADELNISSAENIKNLTKNIKLENAIQLIIYCYLFLYNQKNKTTIQAGIYSLRNLKNGVLELKINNTSEINLEKLDPLLEEIKLLLLEVLDPSIPFIEKQNNFF